jgi:hypothetical protein
MRRLAAIALSVLALGWVASAPDSPAIVRASEPFRAVKSWTDFVAANLVISIRLRKIVASEHIVRNRGLAAQVRGISVNFRGHFS